jgi:hypothetical protein
MAPGKVIYEGTELSEGKCYPPDWLCVCGHALRHHEGSNLTCILRGNVWSSWADQCLKFHPIDNLTLIERLAKEKGL